MMDRRVFLVGLGTCGVLALPLACGPKKVDETAPEEGIEPEMGAEGKGEESGEASDDSQSPPDEG